MTLKWLTYRSRREALCELLQWVEQARACAERPVVLVRSYDEAVRMKHLLARENAGFGVAVLTFDAWLADLWELQGDGSAFVTPLERTVLLRAALEDQVALERSQGKTPLFSCTPGYVRLLSKVVKEAMAALKPTQRDTAAAKFVLAVAARYQQALDRRRLVEPTCAAELLVGRGAFASYGVAAFDVELTALQLDVLQNVETHVLDIAWEAEGDPARPEELVRLQHDLLQPRFDDPVCAQGHVRFALPTGRYAAWSLVSQSIVAWCAQHPGARVAVAAPDPKEWFDQLAPRLAEAGVGSVYGGAVPFEQTPFGSAWCSLLRFAAQSEDAPIDVRLAGDFALSMFSALSSPMARIADSRFRGSRAQTIDDALTDLTAFADESHRDIGAAFAEGRYDEALSAERDWVLSQTAWPAAFRNAALAAIDCATTVHAAAEDAGLSLAATAEVLSTAPVGVSMELAPSSGSETAARGETTAQGYEETVLADDASACRVEFYTLGGLAQLPASSFSCVVLADLSASSYPLSDEQDAADSLLDAWDAGPKRLAYHDALLTDTQRMQKAFAGALACARECVIASRPLNTDEGDEERPSALFEELIDCYRSDPQNVDEIDKATGLTEALGAYAAQRGEDAAAENLARGAAGALVRDIPLDTTKNVSPEARPFILLPRIFSGGAITSEPYLSPSAIESYLECPHLWFARRRLRLDTIDADFGGLAFGNFAHGVLEQLHASLVEAGLRRVTEGNVEQAVDLMNGVFDERFAYEQQRFSKDALIPANELERLEVEQLRARLEALVRREAHLLPDFAPLGQEISFGEGDDEFVYAGVHVTGKVDRIDVDSYGRAVVIDYKGSVGREYAFRTSENDGTVLPRKMQTLIYAQMVRRKMGFVPVGALYLSYGKDGRVRGLFDRTVLDADRDLLGIDPKTCGTSAFLDALDAAEEAVEQRLAHLLAGDVAPAAIDLKTCEYCPVGLCEHRDALAEALGGGGAA